MRFWIVTIIIVGLLVLFNAGGIHPPITGGILEKTGIILTEGNESLSGVRGSVLWGNETDTTTDTYPDTLVALLIGFGIIGIAVSFFGKSPDVNLLSGIIIIVIGGALMSDMAWIGTYAMGAGDTWVKWLILSIFVPTCVGFVITILNFWKGND
jgi:hypothetical protein